MYHYVNGAESNERCDIGHINHVRINVNDKY